MKNKIGLLAGLAFFLCLCSCSPSTAEVASSYLDGHDAVLYYCGEKSEVFETMKNYHDYTGGNFPEELPEICEFVIDVEYSKSKLTVANLNEMYSAFSNGTYLYVAFINYEDDLALFLAGTKFAYDMQSYPHGNPYTRFLTYINNGSAKSVWNYPMNLQLRYEAFDAELNSGRLIVRQVRAAVHLNGIGRPAVFILFLRILKKPNGTASGLKKKMHSERILIRPRKRLFPLTFL